jgi:hypothetical protein
MDPTDHSIEEDLMHVIWAQGQEQNRYVHNPKSGLERDRASVKDFYRQDELKYHGHGAQRGQTTLNFFGEFHICHQQGMHCNTCICVNCSHILPSYLSTALPLLQSVWRQL